MADNNPHSKSKFYEYLCLFHKKLFTLPMVQSSGRKKMAFMNLFSLHNKYKF